MKELIKKLEALIYLLEKNNKKSFMFFQEQLDVINSGRNFLEALERLKKSNSIVQYGDFSFDEEKSYNEMYDSLEGVLNSK